MGYIQSALPKKLFVALKAHGIIDSSKAIWHKSNRAAVNQALTDLFVLGLQPNIIERQKGWGGMMGVLFAVQRHTPWTQSMTEMAFAHLFCVLCQSRWRWKQTPRPPFNTNEHCELAKVIDAFLDAADDKDWWDCDHLFFALPEDKADLEYEGGDDDEEDEDAATATMGMAEVADALEEDLGGEEEMAVDRGDEMEVD
ncbi:hypothetical protein F5Y02DRAFT_423756 [Annulohypoxylon stygium]|nr:hypothetical protein F5Y02DRAFT_423756 [Annulohypoxylon stygium]